MNRFEEKKMGSKGEEWDRERIAGEETENWRGRERTKKMKKSNNNNGGGERDYVTINQNNSIDSPQLVFPVMSASITSPREPTAYVCVRKLAW